MKKPAILTTVLLIAAFGIGSFALQNGYDLFQKALAKERGEGNLEEAIDLYQKVIDETKDESLAAKAQLRIGMCYEKLGQEKAALAQEAFQKVVDKYPAQTDVVKAAREKLLVLLKAQSVTGEGVREFQIRHVLSVKGAEEAHQVSPDGRNLAYFDYNIGKMVVYELATEKKRILDNKIEKNEPEGESWFFHWSPDGKAVVCNWWQVSDWNWTDLRILFIDGSRPRSLFREDYADVYPFDWSSDGRCILAGLYSGEALKGTGMGIISVKDGSMRLLKTIDGRWGNMGFSPDARYIAYDLPPEEGSSKRDIFLLSADGKAEVPLVTHPAHDSFLGWSPEGEYVLFSSDRMGTVDLWIIPVSNGKPGGEPDLIKRGIGAIGSAGMTRDGSFYYITPSLTEDIYIAELDQRTGKIVTPQKKMVLPLQGKNVEPQYSADGKFLAYIRDSFPGSEETSLCIYSLETNEERFFPLKMGGRFPRWSPDGRFVYFSSFVGSNRMRIFRLDLKTGQYSSVSPGKQSEKIFGNAFIGCSPDGKFYYYIHSEAEDRICQIFVRDIETGIEKELFRMDIRLPFVVSLSPDGKWLATISREAQRVLRVLPTSGNGEPRELYQFEHRGGHPTWLAWTPDGNSIIFSKKNDGPGWGLWRISTDGGDPQNLGITTRFISGIFVHPDGRHLVFSSYSSESKAPEIWVMENFLPTEKTEGKGGQK